MVEDIQHNKTSEDAKEDEWKRQYKNKNDEYSQKHNPKLIFESDGLTGLGRCHGERLVQMKIRRGKRDEIKL